MAAKESGFFLVIHTDFQQQDDEQRMLEWGVQKAVLCPVHYGNLWKSLNLRENAKGLPVEEEKNIFSPLRNNSSLRK